MTAEIYSVPPPSSPHARFHIPIRLLYLASDADQLPPSHHIRCIHNPIRRVDNSLRARPRKANVVLYVTLLLLPSIHTYLLSRQKPLIYQHFTDLVTKPIMKPKTAFKSTVGISTKLPCRSNTLSFIRVKSNRRHGWAGKY